MDEADWKKEEVDADLRLHSALRHAELVFWNLISDASTKRQSHELRELRQQPVYAIAEFFYVLRAYGIASREQMLQYVTLHNRDLSALLEDKERMRLNGFTPARIRNAMIDDAAAAKLVINYTNFDRGFDQRDLARLLVEQMSPETCRKTVTKLSDTGFVEREVGVYNAIIVKSTGKLEDIYMTYLRAFRGAFAGTDKPKKRGKA